MDRSKVHSSLKIGAAIGSILLIAGYSLFVAHNYLSGPSITILNPTPNEATSSPVLMIAGTAKNIKNIWLNDRPIFMDEQGYFHQNTLMYPGYNTFTVRGEDRFGRNTITYIRVVSTKD